MPVSGFSSRGSLVSHVAIPSRVPPAVADFIPGRQPACVASSSGVMAPARDPLSSCGPSNINSAAKYAVTAPSVSVAPDCLSVSPAQVCASSLQGAVTAPLVSVAPDCLSVSPALVCASSIPRNLCLVNSFKPVATAKLKILLLCTGPDSRPNSLISLITKAGYGCESFDVVNGPLFDLTDDATWDPLVARVRAGEFAAAFASPPCTTCSKLRNIPGGPPPLRGASGACRYGLPGLSIPNKELVRKHNIIFVRVAQLLRVLVQLNCPWIFENPAQVVKEVSVLNLDEYRDILALPGVLHTIGVQCTFGALSSKPTYWMHFRVDMASMPVACPHAKKIWFNDRTGVGTASRHRPTAGKDTYSATQQVRTSPGVFVPSAPYVSAALAAYPDLLNRFLVAKLVLALAAVAPKSKKRVTGHLGFSTSKARLL
jgi:hypothetical protein